VFELLLYIKVEYFGRIFAAGAVNDVINLLKDDHTYNLLNDLRTKSYLNSGVSLDTVVNTEPLKSYDGDKYEITSIRTKAVADECLGLSLSSDEHQDSQKCSTKGKKAKRSPTSMRRKKAVVTTPLESEEEQKDTTMGRLGPNHATNSDLQECLPGGEIQTTKQLPDFAMTEKKRANEVDGGSWQLAISFCVLSVPSTSFALFFSVIAKSGNCFVVCISPPGKHSCKSLFVA
jgi:hypothetical protein